MSAPGIGGTSRATGTPRTGLVVRALERADAAAYRDLRLRALAEHPTAFTSSFESESQHPLAAYEARLSPEQGRRGKVMLGAWIEGELVGKVGLDPLPRPKERHLAVLVGMYVAPERAGQGIGRALVAALIEHARAVPELRRVQLTVTEGNEAAIALYRRFGFECWGREPDAICVDGRDLAKLHFSLRLR